MFLASTDICCVKIWLKHVSKLNQTRCVKTWTKLDAFKFEQNLLWLNLNETCYVKIWMNLAVSKFEWILLCPNLNESCCVYFFNETCYVQIWMNLAVSIFLTKLAMYVQIWMNLAVSIFLTKLAMSKFWRNLQLSCTQVLITFSNSFYFYLLYFRRKKGKRLSRNLPGSP